ncbi:MAG: transporter substrate-binding domain-containing protein [Desulfobacterales bacterium]|nr:transporter substrate-binding domain-containing protein [Desulfobacterales bacterium]
MPSESKFRYLLFKIVSVLAFTAAALASTGIAGETQTQQPVKPVILSALEIDYPPFCIVDSDGMAKGFSVELMKAALFAMNREVSFRTGIRDEVRCWLERGQIQALPLVCRTPERERLFDFSIPYMEMHGAIVVRKDATGILNLTDLKGRRVAVMKGDNAEEFLQREERGIEIQTAATYENALRELSQGRCDAVVMLRMVALRLIDEMALTNLRIIDRPIEGFTQEFCFAVQEGDRKTLALLNEGLSLVMADGTYRHLHAKWFSTLELPTNRSIRVGGDRNYPPYEYIDRDGRPAGYTVDLTRAIAREMNLNIEIQLGPWTETVQKLEKGDIDIIQGMFYTPERDLKFDFTQPHMVNHYVGIVRKGKGAPPFTLDGLKGKRIVVQRGDAMHEFLLEKGLGDQVSSVETQEDVLKDLADGQYDCALAVRISSLHLIQKHGWTNLNLGRTPFVSMEYCYAVPNNRKALLAEFSEGLKILENSGEYRRIVEKWMGVYEEKPLSLISALRYSAMALAPLLLILLVLFLWSWSLRRQVASRTKELYESREIYRSFFENSMDAILITAPEGGVISANPSACELFGRTEAEMIGLGMNSLVDVSDPRLPEFLAKRERYRKARGELTHIRKDGARFSAEIASAFFMDGFGAIKTSVIIRDATERKAAEKALIAAYSKREELEFIINHSPVIVWLWKAEPGWPVEYVSDNIAQYGYSPDAFTSGRIAYVSIVHPDDFSRISTEVERFVNEGKTDFTQEYRIVAKSGEVRWIDDRTWVRRGADGSISHFQGIVMDITVRKQAEELYQTLTEGSFTCVFIARKGKFVFINAAVEYLGYRAEELTGHDSNMIVHPDDKALVKMKSRELLSKKSNQAFEFRIVTKQNETRWVSQTIAPIYYQGKPAVLGNAMDITIQKQAEQNLALNKERTQILLNLRLMIDESTQAILKYAMEASQKTCLSQFSFIGLMDETESIMTIHAWSKDAMARCASLNKPEQFPISEAGVWGDCVRQRKPVTINDYEAPHPSKKGCPDGHVPIRRLMSIPVLDGDKIVAVAAVANKKEPYTEDDANALISLSNNMWEMLHRKQAETRLKETLGNLRKAVGASIQIMASAIETKDPYTAGHQIRSANLARAIAAEMKLPREQIDGIRMAASIHDIGKLAIPAEILSRPRKLTPVEYELVKEHALKGYELLRNVDADWPLAQIVYQHHERMNGSGYPRGLRGEDILLESRILAVADVVEAMASHRPYRPALGVDAALDEIKNHSGVLYDAKVVNACLRVFRERGFRFEPV